MPEEWKAVAGWPYEVSDLGRVRRAGGRVLAGRVHSHGYLRIILCNDGEQREAYVHQLVCEAFHGPAPQGTQTDHVNRVRNDNRARNLRWVTPTENKTHRVLRCGSQHGNARLTETAVQRIRAAGFKRGQDASLAAVFGVSRETVRDVRLGKAWRHL